MNRETSHSALNELLARYTKQKDRTRPDRCDRLERCQRRSDRRVRFRCDNCPTMKDVLKNRGWAQVEGEDDSWNLFWCEVHQLRATLDHKRLDTRQKVPHFRNYYELTRKNLLNRNLKRLKRQLLRQGRVLEAGMCDCMPITFELPSEHLMFVEEYRRNPGATWIVKPSTGSQGRGIFIFQKLRELKEWRSARETNLNSRPLTSPAAATVRSNVTDSTSSAQPPITLPLPHQHYQSQQNDGDVGSEFWVVQKYIEKPYLIAGKKFDIRFYVLVTSVWMGREGFARLCGELYDLSSLDNQRGHLTNMSIQLRCVDENEKQGCKWSLQRLREFLTARHGYEVIDRLMQRIAHVVLTSLRAVQSAMLQDIHCFELYGYDVLLDCDLNPWLLEVNASPSLNATDAEDYRLKYELLEDVVNVLDLEGKLSGQERQVGGFDLLWDDGPVFRHVPEGSCGVTRPLQATECRPLNVLLGCFNNRAQQLQELEQWRNLISSV